MSMTKITTVSNAIVSSGTSFVSGGKRTGYSPDMHVMCNLCSSTLVNQSNVPNNKQKMKF